MSRFFLARMCVVCLFIFLKACSLPTSVSAVSWAIDGASYVATNKTLTDHGISLLSGKDCALRRFVTRLDPQSICQYHRDPDFSAMIISLNSEKIERKLSRDGADDIFYGFDFTFSHYKVEPYLELGLFSVASTRR